MPLIYHHKDHSLVRNNRVRALMSQIGDAEAMTVNLIEGDWGRICLIIPV